MCVLVLYSKLVYHLPWGLEAHKDLPSAPRFVLWGKLIAITMWAY